MQPSLRDRTQGRWRGILSAFGIDGKLLTGKHGPCPICGGKDRFRFDDKAGNGTWICSQCGAGSGVDLVMRIEGCDFRTAAPKIEAQIGTAPFLAGKTTRTDADKLDDMRKFWKRANPVPVTPGDPVDLYLRNRGVAITAIPSDVRFVAQCRHSESRTSHPAMLALVRDPAGEVRALHRTFLTIDGRKADVDPVRMVMGSLPSGCAVRLTNTGPIMGVAEGIETALSASILFGVPTWAALNDNRLAAWSPPEGVREVVVFADNDENFAGQRAAHQLRERLGSKFSVKIELPTTAGSDWNDELRERRRTAANAGELSH